MLKKGLSDFEIREAMQRKGMRLISDKLKDLLLKGVTSLNEVIRIGLKD